MIYPDQWWVGKIMGLYGARQLSWPHMASPRCPSLPLHILFCLEYSSRPPSLANTFLTLKTLLKRGFLGEASLSPEAEHIMYTPLSSPLASTTFCITDLLSGLYTLLARVRLQAIISLTLRRLQLRGPQTNTEVKRKEGSPGINKWSVNERPPLW